MAAPSYLDEVNCTEKSSRRVSQRKNRGQLESEKESSMPGKDPEGQVHKVAGSGGARGRLPAADTEGFANWLKLYQSKLQQTCERSLEKQSFRTEETSHVER
jgi:hypothetical protein